MSKVAKAWERIDRWFSDNAADEFELAPGASNEEIDRVESEIGLSLPNEMKESYRIHNGSSRLWFFEQGYLMPLDKPGELSKREQSLFTTVIESRTSMMEMLEEGYFEDEDFVSYPEGPIRDDWWHAGWVPITCNDGGDHLCVDLSPEEGGKIGQVIDWWHEQGATGLVAKSFSDLLTATADRFEAGEFEYDSKSEKLSRLA